MRLLESKELSIISGGTNANTILEAGMYAGATMGTIIGTGASIFLSYLMFKSREVVPELLFATCACPMIGMVLGGVLATAVVTPYALILGDNPRNIFIG